MVWKKLWALQLPPKVKVFAWKLAHNSLATQSNEAARRMVNQSTCVICGGVEDGHHAVLMCLHARTLRSAMRKFWKLPSEDKLSYAGFEWHLILILWRSWFVRNELTHSNRVPATGKLYAISDKKKCLIERGSR